MQKSTLQIAGRHRPCKQIPLCLVTPPDAQPFELGLPFDSFGRDDQIERLRERHDGVDDRRVEFGSIQVLDETAVDFQPIRRKSRQAGQGRASGAEIVQCNAASEIAQRE